MINHFRTLLMNVDGEGTGYRSTLGEEFIPPNFKALTNLPGYITGPRRILFGPDPDRAMRNYRTRQLLAVTHATELEAYIFDLDSRITYETGLVDDLYRNAFGIQVIPAVGTTATLAVSGKLGSPDARGRLSFQWDVLVNDSDEVTVTQLTDPFAISVQNYTVTNGLSSQITLPGSQLTARFSPGVGSRWSVDGLVRPSRDLGELLQLLPSPNDPAAVSLFAAGTTFGQQEPWPTFRNLWKDHHELPYRMGAFLLAMVYRMERIRQNLNDRS